MLKDSGNVEYDLPEINIDESLFVGRYQFFPASNEQDSGYCGYVLDTVTGELNWVYYNPNEDLMQRRVVELQQ